MGSGLRRWLGVGAVIGLCLVLGYWALMRLRPPSFHGMVVQSPEPAPNFRFTRQPDGDLELRDFRGRYVLLFFGYTSCPDVCPLTLAHLARMQGELSERQAQRVQVLFVSVDPARDTPERLAAYTGAFGPGIRGVTGSEEELIGATTPFGIYYKRHEPDANGAYAVDHTGTVTVIDPDGYVRLVWPYGLTAEEMKADLTALLR